jgi:CRISPR-associated RAMP protein (TIGR02581 family)
MSDTKGSIRMDRLDNRYIITGELELITAISISSGRPNLDTDSPFMRTKSGSLYIPGSSMRGAFRSTIERILSSLALPQLTSCILFEESSGVCLNSNETEKSAFMKKVESEKIGEDDIIKNLDSDLCDVCKVFGTTFSASKVKFTDLYPLNESSCVVAKRDGVGIDRDTKTAVDGAKFDYEVVEKGANFSFEMILENVDQKDLAVISVGLNELKRGDFWMGGNGAAGLGRCKLNNLAVPKYFDNINEYITGGYNEAGSVDKLILENLKKVLEVNNA